MVVVTAKGEQRCILVQSPCHCDVSYTGAMAPGRLLLVAFLLLLLVNPSAGGWWRRRRRSGCRPTHCAWGGWSDWGACSDPCGNAGTQTRSRSVATAKKCGGSDCAGSSRESKECNRFCHNGGTPRAGHCDCPDEFWGTCCGHRELAVILRCLNLFKLY